MCVCVCVCVCVSYLSLVIHPPLPCLLFFKSHMLTFSILGCCYSSPAARHVYGEGKKSLLALMRHLCPHIMYGPRRAPNECCKSMLFFLFTDGACILIFIHFDVVYVSHLHLQGTNFSFIIFWERSFRPYTFNNPNGKIRCYSIVSFLATNHMKIQKPKIVECIFHVLSLLILS